MNTTETGVYDLTITYYDDENEIVESANVTVYLDYTSYVVDEEIDITDYHSTLVSIYVFDFMNDGHFEIEIYEDTDDDPIRVLTIDADNQIINPILELTNERFNLREGSYAVRAYYVPNDEDLSDHEISYWKYSYFHDDLTIVDNSKFRVRMESESILDENSQFLVYCPEDSVGSTITIKVTSEDTIYSFDFAITESGYNLFDFDDLKIDAPGLYEFNIYDENSTSLIETYEYEVGNPLFIPDVCVLGAVGLERTPVVVLYIDKIDNGRLVLTDENRDVIFNETLTDDYYHSLGYEEGYYILYSDCNPALNEGTHFLTASYYIVDDDNGEYLRLSHTSEIRIVERNYVEDDDTGIGIELFDYKEHNLNDEEDLIACVSVPEYEQGYVTVVLKDDENAIMGEFTFDEIDDDDGLPTFFVSLFDRGADEGDYLVDVTYFDGDDNPVLSSSAWMSFYYSDDDEEENGLSIYVDTQKDYSTDENSPDADDAFITVYAQDGTGYHVAVFSSKKIFFDKNLTDFENAVIVEDDEEFEGYWKYAISLRDVDFLNGLDEVDKIWIGVYKIEDGYKWIDASEDYVVFFNDDSTFSLLQVLGIRMFYGNLTSGETEQGMISFNTEDFINIEIPGSADVHEMNVTVDYGGETRTYSLTDFNVNEPDPEDEEFDGYTYYMELTDDIKDLIRQHENETITFNFTYEYKGKTVSASFKRILNGEILYKVVSISDLYNLFDFNIADDVLLGSEDEAVRIFCFDSNWHMAGNDWGGGYSI